MRRTMLVLGLVGILLTLAPARVTAWEELVDAEGGKVRMLRPSGERGTSQATVVDGLPLVHTGQVVPIDDDGNVVGGEKAEDQTAVALEGLGEILRAAGSSLERVVKLNVYVANESDMRGVREEIARVMHFTVKPAVSYVITPLGNSGALVGVDAVAVLDPSSDPDSVTLAASDRSDVPGGGQSAILPSGGRIQISGQAEKADDLRTAVRKTIGSLRDTLKFLGRSDADIVQLKGFVKPASKAATVYTELANLFGSDSVPPVVLVEWESDTPIEIELVAWDGRSTDATRDVEFLTPPGMTTPTIYSRVTRTHHPRTIYTSGLYGERSAGSEEQVKEIFTTLESILRATGSDMKHLLKATYYVSDNAASQKLNDLRPHYFDPKRPPAASKAMVKAVGRKGKTITMDMIAVPGR